MNRRQFLAALFVAPLLSVPAYKLATVTKPVSLTLVLKPGDPRTVAVIRFVEQTFGAGTPNGTSNQFA